MRISLIGSLLALSVTVGCGTMNTTPQPGVIRMQSPDMQEGPTTSTVVQAGHHSEPCAEGAACEPGAGVYSGHVGHGFGGHHGGLLGGLHGNGGLGDGNGPVGRLRQHLHTPSVWAPTHYHTHKYKHPTNLRYPTTGVPAGVWQYPYYPVRGPSDFFMP